MTRHETCADSCSLGDFLKCFDSSDETCEDGYCELQEITSHTLYQTKDGTTL
jgi:hypothetical protein